MDIDVPVGSYDYTIRDLMEWDEKIRALVDKFGLDPFGQEFEICHEDHMLGYMAYSGMPAHYPHWSYGKSYEQTKTKYDYGVAGLPYEMVINSNPSIAYLMRNNTLSLQILTMAHVYGHNDFFRRNFMFQQTDPANTVARFKSGADRIRDYAETFGTKVVEEFIDAAHAVSMNCNRNLSRKRLTKERQRERIRARFEKGTKDDHQGLHKRVEVDVEGLEAALMKVPLEPEEDVLLFIAEENPNLKPWQVDVLHIIHEQTRYFIPQMETKIMNEGWASLWHHRILNALELPDGLHLEFAVNHSQVLRPHPGSLNPYHLGFTMWRAIEVYYNGMIDEGSLNPDYHEPELFARLRRDFEDRDSVPPDAGKMSGDEKIFEVRESCNDRSFIRRFMSPVLVRDTELFSYEEKKVGDGYEKVITDVGDDDSWMKIRDMLADNVGMGSIPVLKIVEADRKARGLVLEHQFDGRTLDPVYAKKTIAHLRDLWMKPVTVSTMVDDKPVDYVLYSKDEEVKEVKEKEKKKK